MRIGARVLAPKYACVTRTEWIHRFRDTVLPVLPKGAHYGTRATMGCDASGKISASTTENGVHLVRGLDDPGPITLPLPPARYTTSTGAVQGSWCLHAHVASAFPRGVQRSVDESRMRHGRG